jgi:hypothetical protein
MATGYTYKVVEGEITEFKDFLLRCARAFGPCIDQRDDDLDTPPKLMVVDSYYFDEWEKSKKKLEIAESESLEEFTEREKVNIKNHHEYLVKNKAEKEIQRERLEKMLDAVNGWSLPSEDHASLKSFMIAQLEESIEWGGHIEPVPEIDYDQDYSQLREEAIRYLKRDVEYYHNEYLEHVENVNRSNDWITKLYESVK